MTNEDPLFPGRTSTYLEWTSDVPLDGIAVTGVGTEEGKRIGVALFFALVFGVLAWWLLPLVPGVKLFAAPLVAIAAASWWLLPRGHKMRGADANISSWPVRFVVHDLGAEALGGDPPPNVAVALDGALHSRAASDSFLRGMGGGVSSGSRALGRWYENRRFSFRRANGGKAAYGTALDWNRLTGIAIDPSDRVIDLAGADAPGLRLLCTPDNFDEVRAFVRKNVDSRFWPTLS